MKNKILSFILSICVLASCIFVPSDFSVYAVADNTIYDFSSVPSNLFTNMTAIFFLQTEHNIF